MPGVYISERIKPFKRDVVPPPAPPPPPPPPFSGNNGSFDNWTGTQSFILPGPLAIARTVGE